MDRRPCLADERAAPQRRTLAHPRDRGVRAGVLDRDLRRARLARTAATGCILYDLGAALDGRGRPAQAAHQRRLPVGPRAVRRPFPVRRAVRRPSRRVACRSLLSCGARQLRLRIARPILRVSRAPCRAREAGNGTRAAHRTDVRVGAAGARRALRLARFVECLPGLADRAVGLCIRISRALVGSGGT